MNDNEITAIVGWPNEPQMVKYRAVAAAAEKKEREACIVNFYMGNHTIYYNQALGKWFINNVKTGERMETTRDKLVEMIRKFWEEEF